MQLFDGLISMSIGSFPTLASGDFDGDGNLDLVGQQHESSRLVLLRGLGSRGYAPPTTYAFAEMMRSIASLDWDGDGFDDILLDGGESRTGLQVIRGRKDLALRPPVRIADGADIMATDPIRNQVVRVRADRRQVERLRAGSADVTSSMLPFKVDSIHVDRDIFVAHVRFLDGTRLLRLNPESAPCMLEFDAPNGTTWGRIGNREVLAAPYGAMYTSSTYVALWREAPAVTAR